MASMREEFEQHGFVIQRGLFDPATDLEPIKQSYTELITDLARTYLAEQGIDLEIEQLSPPEQFCVMLGASRGKALHHLDPVLNVFTAGYQWRPDLPDPRNSELFDLMRHPRLLDAIEQLIGGEITAAPLHHVNQKPAARHLQVADDLARLGGVDLSDELFYTLQVGRTGWHMDAIAGMPDAHDSDIINAWIPITPATEENGCLMVIPGSHKDGVKYKPYPPDLDERGVPLPVEPGDVIFLHNKIMHCSVANISEDDFRWAFNFRYLETGQPTGRPFLPGFVARSRKAPESELKDYETWRMMWVRALDYIAGHGVPTTYQQLRDLSLEEAEEITRQWQQRAPDPEGWLRLKAN